MDSAPKNETSSLTYLFYTTSITLAIVVLIGILYYQYVQAPSQEDDTSETELFVEVNEGSEIKNTLDLIGQPDEADLLTPKEIDGILKNIESDQEGIELTEKERDFILRNQDTEQLNNK